MSKPKTSDAKGISAFRRLHPKLTIEQGVIIAPAENRYAVTEKDYVIPWDLNSYFL